MVSHHTVHDESMLWARAKHRVCADPGAWHAEFGPSDTDTEQSWAAGDCNLQVDESEDKLELGGDGRRKFYRKPTGPAGAPLWVRDVLWGDGWFAVCYEEVLLLYEAPKYQCVLRLVNLQTRPASWLHRPRELQQGALLARRLISKQAGRWRCQRISTAERRALVAQAQQHPFCCVRAWIEERGTQCSLMLSCSNQLVGLVLPTGRDMTGQAEHSLWWLPDGSGVTFRLSDHRCCVRFGSFSGF